MKNKKELRPTKKTPAVFTGTVVHVCPDNPKFLLLQDVTQRGRKIDVGDGIWLLLNREKHVQPGFKVSCKGHTELAEFGGASEYMIRLAFSFKVIEAYPPPEDIFEEPSPKIRFKGASVMFSGESKFPTWKSANSAGCEILDWHLDDLTFDGVTIQDVVEKADYLVVGEGGNADWKYGNYGIKIHHALKLKEDGHKIKIVKAQDFVEQSNFETHGGRRLS